MLGRGAGGGGKLKKTSWAQTHGVCGGGVACAWCGRVRVPPAPRSAGRDTGPKNKAFLHLHAIRLKYDSRVGREMSAFETPSLLVGPWSLVWYATILPLRYGAAAKRNDTGGQPSAHTAQEISFFSPTKVPQLAQWCLMSWLGLGLGWGWG